MLRNHEQKPHKEFIESNDFVDLYLRGMKQLRLARYLVAILLLTSTAEAFAESSTQADSQGETPEKLSPGEIALRDAAPDSDVAKLAAEIESRLAAGEIPPNDILDLNFQLVNCDGLTAAELETEGYLAIGFDRPDIACENTKGGQRLLERRRWECAAQPSRSCVCGKRTRHEFFYFMELPQYRAASFGPGMRQFSIALDGSKNSLFFRFEESVTYGECSYDEPVESTE